MDLNRSGAGQKTFMLMYSTHLGKILSALSVIGIIILLSGVMTFVISIFYYLILLIISLVTLFTIYVQYPEFANAWSGGEFLLKVSDTLMGLWIYVGPVTIVLSAASLVLVCLDRAHRSVGKIVFSSILLALSVILVIARIVLNGGAA